MSPTVFYREMLRHRQTLFLSILALALAGCSGPPVSLSRIGGEKRYTSQDAVGVYIEEPIASRVESLWGPFGEERVRVVTGDVWKRLFVGFSDSRSRLLVTSTKLEESMAGGGFTIRYTYTVHATLSVDGHTVEIESNGTRAAAVAALSAMRQAV